MPRPKGIPKTGGRKPGSTNKVVNVREACADVGVDPFKYMALAVADLLQCSVCRGTMKMKFRIPGSNRLGVRDCSSCPSRPGFEKLSPEFRGKMASDLAAYLAPKLSSTAVTGADGIELPTWQVIVKREE